MTKIWNLIESNKSLSFVETSCFVTSFTASQVEVLYFLQGIEKGIVESKLSDHYGHVILLGEIILRDTTSDLFDLEIPL